MFITRLGRCEVLPRIAARVPSGVTFRSWQLCNIPPRCASAALKTWQTCKDWKRRDCIDQIRTPSSVLFIYLSGGSSRPGVPHICHPPLVRSTLYSLLIEEETTTRYQGNVNVFANDRAAGLYEPIPEYEDRHRPDSTANWTAKQEKKLVRRVR